ncbi:hypothetical protein THRCLA_02686 [Thraustotheca clavata]|uniref:Uncharacterized protein n=1 Tax=Thraustotheca clavata TaxID=74557 RepID=A0A1W0A4B7_9STRA|nr:hypothetical protein THRCLA_02686 [Thraustotheca clavata]
MKCTSAINYSQTTMNLWTYFPLTSDDPPQWLMLREFSWFLVPMYYSRHTRRVMVYQKDTPDDLPELQCVPQHFLDHFLPSVKAVPMFGLVTKPLDAVKFTSDTFQVDNEFLWCSGWVILSGLYALCQDDLPNIFTNVIFQASMYCCHLDMRNEKMTLVPQLITFRYWKIHWYDFLAFH